MNNFPAILEVSWEGEILFPGPVPVVLVTDPG